MEDSIMLKLFLALIFLLFMLLLCKHKSVNLRNEELTRIINEQNLDVPPKYEDIDI